MNYKISVSQKHIDDGIRGLCKYCPVALAIEEALAGKYQQVNVTNYNLWIDNGDIIPIYIGLPESVQAFICDYDKDSPVEPFSFEINIP